MNAAVEKQEVAGINLLVLKDGKEEIYCEAGFADIAEQKPMKRDTICRLYSMTKPVTGAAIMLLMERGLLDLADPVSMYLEGFRNQTVNKVSGTEPVKRPVTVRDLLSMTSGLPYGHEGSITGKNVLKLFEEAISKIPNNGGMGTIELANRLGGCGLEFQPGETFMYGTSADILGAVAEAVSGMSFGDFLEKEFFEPLGMKDTAFYVPDEKLSRLAKVYEETGDGLREIDTNHLGVTAIEKIAFESGGAGLVSTLDDYEKFATMLMQSGKSGKNQILKPQTVAYFTSGQLTNWQRDDLWKSWDGLCGYSYGNLMRVLAKPGLAVGLGGKGEYGWDGWLGAYFCNAPKEKLTILAMLQKKDAGTTHVVRKLRNVIFSAKDE